jgi:uncharacterized protein
MGQAEVGVWSNLEGRYLSITSVRRDGTPVATPVWFVRDGARLLVQTDRDSYKMKRIRRNPAVTIAVCNARGRLRGQPVAAIAEQLPDTELARAEGLLAAKYRIDLLLFKPLRALQAALGRGRGRPIALALTPKA